MESEKFVSATTKIEVKGLIVGSARAGLDLFSLLAQHSDLMLTETTTGQGGFSKQVLDPHPC